MQEDGGATAAERRSRGTQRFHEVMGSPAPAVDGPLHEFVVDVAFGTVWDRPGLTTKERRWVTLTAVCAAGEPFALDGHVRAAMRTGDCTYAELKELALHLAVYLGAPKAATMDRAIEAARAAGVGGGEPGAVRHV